MQSVLLSERKPATESRPPLRQVQPISSVVVVAFRGGKGCHGLLDLSASESVQVMHALSLELDAVLAPVPGLSKHNHGVSSATFCVSAGLSGTVRTHAAAALDAALRLREAARQSNQLIRLETQPVCINALHAADPSIDMPDGNALALSIGIASGCLGDGLIGSPGNMQYQIVGRPVAVAQRLATRGAAGSVRVAPETWELLRCCDAGTSIKPSSWRPSFKLLMGASDILDCYSYEPGWASRELQWMCSPASGTAKGAVLPRQRVALPCNSAPAMSEQKQTSFVKPAYLSGSFDGRLEQRFRIWFATQQGQRDAGVAVLNLALAVDFCCWQASRRLSAGSSVLVPIFLLLPMLLVCCGILLLQRLQPAMYMQRRGMLVGLMHFWRTVQISVTSTAAPYAMGATGSATVVRGTFGWMLWLLPHLTAVTACVVSALSRASQDYAGIRIALPALALTRITGLYRWVGCAFAAVYLGLMQGGMPGEQLLAGVACVIAMIRTDASRFVFWPLVLVSTLVPLVSARLQEIRARRVFLVASDHKTKLPPSPLQHPSDLQLSGFGNTS